MSADPGFSAFSRINRSLGLILLAAGLAAIELDPVRIAAGRELDYGGRIQRDFDLLFAVRGPEPQLLVDSIRARHGDTGWEMLLARLAAPAPETWVGRHADDRVRRAILRSMRAVPDPAFAPYLRSLVITDSDAGRVLAGLFTLVAIDRRAAITAATVVVETGGGGHDDAAKARVRQAFAFLVETVGFGDPATRRASEALLAEGDPLALHAACEMGADAAFATRALASLESRLVLPGRGAEWNAFLLALDRARLGPDHSLTRRLVTRLTRADPAFCRAFANAVAGGRVVLTVSDAGLVARLREHPDAAIRAAAASILLRLAPGHLIEHGGPLAALARLRD